MFFFGIDLCFGDLEVICELKKLNFKIIYIEKLENFIYRFRRLRFNFFFILRRIDYFLV